MPRPERPLDPSRGPVEAFAAELRKLRVDAGLPKYLAMARATGRSRTALSEAAGGDHLPTWETVDAFVRACHGDPAHWRARWEQARDEGARLRLSPTGLPPLPPTDASTQDPDPIEAAPPAGVLAVIPPASHVVIAPAGQPPHAAASVAARRWGRGPRRWLAVGGSLAVAVFGFAVAADAFATEFTVAGTVSCPTGTPVVGVWVKAESPGSGFARFVVLDSPSRVQFSRDLERASPWTVNVGCGGSGKDWQHKTYGTSSATDATEDWACVFPPDAKDPGTCTPAGTSPPA